MDGKDKGDDGWSAADRECCFNTCLDEGLLHEFDGCDHIMVELVDYSLHNRVPIVQLYSIINEVYLARELEYEGLDFMRTMQKDLWLLDVVVRTELEKYVGGHR